MEHKGFPKLQKRINDFLLEEEGTIPRSKIITVGTMLLLLSVFFVNDAFAGHRSHSSHRSHRRCPQIAGLSGQLRDSIHED